MERFIVFVSRQEEIDDYRQKYRDVDFTFVSFVKVSDEVIVINKEDYQGTVDKLYELHKRSPFTGVLNRREKFVIIAALAAEKLNLRKIISNPYLARDKYVMNRTLAPYVNCAKSELVRSEDDIRNMATVEFPCVLKPRFGFNSRCVVRVNDKDELLRKFTKLRPIYKRLKHEDSENDDFIVQSFIDGTEHNVESFIKDNKIVLQIVSDKLTMTPPYFIEIGDVMPTLLDEESKQKVMMAAEQAMNILGVQNGWTHIEVKLLDGKAYVMEVAARMGGGYFEEMIREVYGIDRMKMLIDMHMGKECAATTKADRVVIGKRLVAYGANVVMMIRGLRELTCNENFKMIWKKFSRMDMGFVVGPPYNYKNTVLEYFVTGRSPDDAFRAFDLVNRSLKIYNIRIPELIYRPYMSIAGRLRREGLDH